MFKGDVIDNLVKTVEKAEENASRVAELDRHEDTDEHRAGCTFCQYVHDSKLP